MTVRLVFAHGRLSQAAPTAPPGTEARARLRAAVVDEARGLEAWLAVGRAARVGTALSPWIVVDLPHGLEDLLAPYLEREEPVEVAVPAAVQAELERLAPRSWQRMLTRMRVVQRDGAWQVSRASGALRLSWRPAGEGVQVERSSPLLSLADHLVRGRLPGSASPSPAALALVRRVLEARWITRRLPPELSFGAATGTLRLRLAPDAAAVVELDASEGGDGHALRLETADDPAPLRLEAAPGQGVPPRVARAALAWLFGSPRADASLFLDASGAEPAERRALGPFDAPDAPPA